MLTLIALLTLTVLFVLGYLEFKNHQATVTADIASLRHKITLRVRAEETEVDDFLKDL